MALSLCLLMLADGTAFANPSGQGSFITPTPDASGKIYYTVVEGDNCATIHLRFNLTFDELRRLNNLGPDCIIHPDQQLLVSKPPVNVDADPRNATRTPTPVVEGVGNICVLLYNDINGNGFVDDGENAIAEGPINLVEQTGKVTMNSETLASIDEPYCFADIPNGVYNISVAVPEGYNATTRSSYILTLNAGDNSIIDFGAQKSSSAEPLPVKSGGRSPMLAIVGALIIAAGGALAYYARKASFDRNRIDH